VLKKWPVRMHMEFHIESHCRFVLPEAKYHVMPYTTLSVFNLCVIYTLTAVRLRRFEKREMPSNTGVLGVLTAALALTGCHASEIPPLALTLANK
jgi:hypothetical protein